MTSTISTIIAAGTFISLLAVVCSFVRDRVQDKRRRQKQIAADRLQYLNQLGDFGRIDVPRRWKRDEV